MASRFRILVVAALSFGILSGATVRADTITVTSGTAGVPWDDAPWFSLKGDGFVLSGLFSSVTLSPQRTCFLGCAPGTSIDLTTAFAGQLGLSQAATVNGVTYADPGRFDTWLQLRGQLSFDAGAVTAPALLAPGADIRGVSLTTPFLFSGQVSAYRDTTGAPEGALFTATLTGSGTATLRLIDDGSGAWRFPEVSFPFEQPVATPEPASLALLASGLAGLLVSVRRKRH